MTPNPFDALFHSRKFWLAVLDGAAGTLALLTNRFLSPDDAKLVLVLWGIWQPVIVAVIYGYTVQNVAAIKAAAPGPAPASIPH